MFHSIHMIDKIALLFSIHYFFYFTHFIKSLEIWRQKLSVMTLRKPLAKAKRSISKFFTTKRMVSSSTCFFRIVAAVTYNLDIDRAKREIIWECRVFKYYDIIIKMIFPQHEEKMCCNKNRSCRRSRWLIKTPNWWHHNFFINYIKNSILS